MIGGDGTVDGAGEGESADPCESRLSLDWGWGWSCDWALGWRSTISTGDASAGLSLSWSLLGTSTVGGGVSLESISPIASIAPPSMSVNSAIDAWDDMAESAEAWRPTATADPDLDDVEGAGSGEWGVCRIVGMEGAMGTVSGVMVRGDTPASTAGAL